MGRLREEAEMELRDEQIATERRRLIQQEKERLLNHVPMWKRLLDWFNSIPY